MLFKNILGSTHLKKHLTATADNGRIPHAQLFVGATGYGTLPMAIAYAQYVLCKNTEGENTNGNQSCNVKFNSIKHPDLHFSYPVISGKTSSKPKSTDFITEWRNFVNENPYGSLYDWYQSLGVKNQQGEIRVNEAAEILKTLSLKSYEGGFKVSIIWGADKMNTDCANKLLKLIEEPPNKTLLILIAENEEDIIQTIRSRCQVLHFPPLGEQVIADALKEHHNTSSTDALKIANRAQGNYNTALHFLHNDDDDLLFEEWFIAWVRTAFKAKGNKASIRDLISWSEEIAAVGRESQKRFLLYCQNFFRQALMQNYTQGKLVYLEPATKGFQIEKFAPFVHGNNIIEITEELEKAIYHIERNVNAKLVLTDLSIKLTRLLHKKA
ncbi:DNA polymerase III subunit [Mesonia aestuariivivens]|uniref:DNA polymerase III subunit delta n=1 Tax=Mesonia aestuariivivens TaxID=2796128 RepID=A0ABS6W138_9FLAO|nr:DNA polymerase III subunit delta' [Mesonia aestuariivivens]MBW2961545.1 DNA polymerase III subunit delta' [Mesonia aestuariivivens]